MKFVLAVLLALLTIAQGAVEIKSFTLSDRTTGKVAFSVVVDPNSEAVTLEFELRDGVTVVNSQTKAIAPSEDEQTVSFEITNLSQLTVGKDYVAEVTATGITTDAETLQFTYRIKSFSKGSQTNGDVGFTVLLNVDGQRTDLTFSVIDVATGMAPDGYGPQTDNQVVDTTEDQTRAFNLTGLPGDAEYLAKVELRPRGGGTLIDSATVAFSVPAYSSITLLDPVLTSPTDGGSPSVTLSAEVLAKGGTVTAVEFEYGTANGVYSEQVPFDTMGPGRNDSIKYSAKIPVGDKTLRRGFTYHYRVVVTMEPARDGTTTTTTASQNATFTTPANRAPIAVADTIRLRGDRPITFDPTKNDRDPDGDAIELVSVTQGSQGSVAIVNGQVKYTPRPDANGGDTFTYKIKDDYDDLETDAKENQFATGTVTIIAPGLRSRGLHTAEIKDADGNVVGLIRLYGTGGGSVSGKVHLFSKTYTVQGEIGANGEFHFTIPREGEDPLQLEVDFESEGDGVFDVSIGTLEETWRGEAVPYNITDARRDELVGKYTVEFPAPGGDGLPQGIGYAQIDVRPWGEVAVRGRLGDGTKFSTKAILAGSDQSPIVTIWATPGDSRISLTLNLGADSMASLSGPMKWYRSPDGSAEFFPDGFYTEISASGSRFTPSEGRNRSLDDANKATLTFSNGNISRNIVQQLEISKSDRVSFLNANPFGVTLKINRGNGTFKGQFDHPFDDSRRTFHGVILQNQGKASGVFTGVNQTGSVSLTIGITNPTPAPTPTPTTPATPTNPANPGRADFDFGF